MIEVKYDRTVNDYDTLKGFIFVNPNFTKINDEVIPRLPGKTDAHIYYSRESQDLIRNEMGLKKFVKACIDAHVCAVIHFPIHESFLYKEIVSALFDHTKWLLRPEQNDFEDSWPIGFVDANINGRDEILNAFRNIRWHKNGYVYVKDYAFIYQGKLDNIMLYETTSA